MARRASQSRDTFGGVLVALENDARLLAIPTGGTTGQVLSKNSSASYDTSWTSVAGGGGSSRVTASGVALGTQAASQSVFTWYSVPTVAARGLVSLFTVAADSAGTYDIEVRGAGSSGGTLFLQAIGVSNAAYTNATAWYYENDAAGQTFFVGVRNTGAAPRTFTLSALRVERFA